VVKPSGRQCGQKIRSVLRGMRPVATTFGSGRRQRTAWMNRSGTTYSAVEIDHPSSSYRRRPVTYTTTPSSVAAPRYSGEQPSLSLRFTSLVSTAQDNDVIRPPVVLSIHVLSNSPSSRSFTTPAQQRYSTKLVVFRDRVNIAPVAS
jgi:hypothetical protein